jgi:MFS transporter, AAHS family, cis,cis-muconate transporter
MITSMNRTGKLVTLGVFVALVVDGMDLQMLSIALPSISNELSLSGIRAGALGTYTFLVFTICTGLIGFAQTYWQVALFRFLSGFGIAGLYTIGTMLAAEYVPTRIRTTVLGILQAGWSVGYVIAAALSAYVLARFGWRSLFLCAVLPGAAALLLLRTLPDPPSWSRSNTVRRASATNGFRALWQHPIARRNAVLWTVTSIALQFGYYGANTWLPSYLVRDLGLNLQSMGWYVAATYAMMIVGKVAAGYAADLFGRRAVWIAAGILTAAYLPLFVYNATAANVPYLLLGFGLLYGAPYAVNATYMSESFPTSVRGTAVGVAYNVGRIGATSSPLLIGFMASTYSIGAGIALLGVSYAICALVPGLFIAEKLFDPTAVDEAPATASRTAPSGAPARAAANNG